MFYLLRDCLNAGTYIYLFKGVPMHLLLDLDYSNSTPVKIYCYATRPLVVTKLGITVASCYALCSLVVLVSYSCFVRYCS